MCEGECFRFVRGRRIEYHEEKDIKYCSCIEERAAGGLNTLAWDEDAYNFACIRAKEIISNFAHADSLIGAGYAENILYYTGSPDAGTIHNMWYNSQGHHENYMTASYTKGACAVYYYNGTTYAVENFAY